MTTGATLQAHRWQAAGATVTGASHRRHGGGCHDAHGIEMGDGPLVIAVADGAGSAPRAATGAALAVGSALESARLAVLADHADARSAVTAAVAGARAALESAAEAAGCAIGELATTLLVAVAHDGVLASAQVGDGALVVKSGGVAAVVDPAPRGEYRNETTFVTSPTWADHVRISSRAVADVEALAALTDGLELLALDLASDAPHGGFFDPLWKWLASRPSPAEGGPDEEGQVDAASDAGAELAEFLSSSRVQSRADDDLTLVVAVRAPLPATA